MLDSVHGLFSHAGTAAAVGKRESSQHRTFPEEGSIMLPAEMANALDLSGWGSDLVFLGDRGSWYWLVLVWFFHNCNHSSRLGPVALEGLPS